MNLFLQATPVRHCVAKSKSSSKLSLKSLKLYFYILFLDYWKGFISSTANRLPPSITHYLTDKF